MSSFGTLPRAMSTAASLGHTLGEAAAASDSRKSEYSMSKVESIASTAVRAAAKMKVRSGVPVAPGTTTHGTKDIPQVLYAHFDLNGA